MRAPVLLLLLALAAPSASAAHGVSLASQEAVLLSGDVRVEGPGGILWSESLDHTGTLTWRNVTGRLAVWTTEDARVRAGGNSAATTTADATFVERDLQDATLSLDVDAESFALVVVAPDGTVAVAGTGTSEGVPERVGVPVRSSTGTGVTPFRTRERVDWEWPQDWVFVGDVRAYEVPLQGFPVPARAAADVRGPAAMQLYGGVLEVRQASGKVETFELGERADGVRTEQRWAVLDVKVASASLALPDQWGLAAPTMTWTLDGRVRWTGASGGGHVGEDNVTFTDAVVEGRGIVTVGLAPPSAALEPARYQADGEWTSFAVDGAAIQLAPALPVAPVAAASALLVLLALLLRLAFPFYTRLSREDLLAHPRRALLFRLVCEEPGIHQRELARKSGIVWGAFRGHLEFLVSTGYLRLERRGRYTLVYPTGALASGGEIPNPQARAVLAALPADGSPVPLRALRERLDISRQLLNYHAKVLSRAGVARVEETADGRALARTASHASVVAESERASAP